MSNPMFALGIEPLFELFPPICSWDKMQLYMARKRVAKARPGGKRPNHYHLNE